MTPQEVGERGDLLIGEHLQVINLSLLVEPVLQKEVDALFHLLFSLWTEVLGGKCWPNIAEASNQEVGPAHAISRLIGEKSC